VPSPQDCWFRKQKIILKDEESPTTQDIINSTELTISSKKETSTQTRLSFPPDCREIEDFMKKFHIKDDMAESNDNSMMDISTLRRKLFIPTTQSPELDDFKAEPVSLSPPPRTPDLEFKRDDVICSAKSNDNCVGSDMFGELSPIDKLSPISCSMDVSMKSNEKTPSRVFNRKKYPKKNLSESFCMMQNIEIEEHEEFHFTECDKRTIHFQPSNNTSKLRFARFDSGFQNSDDDDELSNDMQF